MLIREHRRLKRNAADERYVKPSAFSGKVLTTFKHDCASLWECAPGQQPAQKPDMIERNILSAASSASFWMAARRLASVMAGLF